MGNQLQITRTPSTVDVPAAVKDAIEYTRDNGGELWEVRNDSGDCVVIGAIPVGPPPLANVWMEGDLSLMAKPAFIRQSRPFIKGLYKKYGRLYGTLEGENARLDRFLTWLGCTVCGTNGVKYFTYTE